MLIMFGAAVAGVLVEAFAPRRLRYPLQLTLSLGASVAALVAVVMLAGHRGSAVMGSLIIDGPALFFQGTLLLVCLVALASMAQRRVGAFAAQGASVPGGAEEQLATRVGVTQTEIFPLTLLAVGGMLVFVASRDLLTMFVALEVLSLPLYVLCGLARRHRLLSQEAALKYFLLGAFSSAFFLFGVALLYGYAGTLTLSGIADAISAGRDDQSMALVGVALLSVGLLFKIGAVPFHSWIPDVYQGAPTPITGFMAAATKIAAFGAMLRVLYVALPGFDIDWRPVLWAVAILTMMVGAVQTVNQTDIKRLLAYSSVANAGFVLGGVTAMRSGLPATMFYLLAYGFITLGAFAVVGMIDNSEGDENTDITRWSGLGRRSPLAAAALTLFLLAFAGVPLTSGFVSKFAIFKAVLTDGAIPLVIVGVISSAIAAFAYSRVIVMMYFSEPGPFTPRSSAMAGWGAVTIAAAATVTVLMGITPQPLLDLAEQAGQFLR